MSDLDLSLRDVLISLPGQLHNAEAPILEMGKSPHYSEFTSDSRAARADGVFLCIKGERVDGHDYIDEVVRRGVRLVIGDDGAKLKAAADRHSGTQFLAVTSSLEAVQKLAAHYRRKFSIPVIGLTGSNGKTTTKDLTAGILAAAGPALVTEGTLNNHWGVPQMVLRLRHEHKAAVFELGTSDFGEIRNLSSICQPDIGFITTIGASHLEKLGNEEGVLRAKRELFDWIVEHGVNRVLLFNLDSPWLLQLYDEFRKKTQSELTLISISQKLEQADIRLVSARALGVEHRFGWEYEFASPWGPIRGTLPLPGAHNLANAMAAASLAMMSGVATVDHVTRGLAAAQISKLRSDLFRSTTGAIIFNDSYNANPTSVTALFEAARAIRTGGSAVFSKTVAVVGDMLELGPDSPKLHRKMGRRAAQDGVDVLLATGGFAREWVEGFREARASSHAAALDFPTHDSLWSALSEELSKKPEETLVLIKGSRGAKMDRIVERLKAADGIKNV